jgi:hypothetical protein
VNKAKAPGWGLLLLSLARVGGNSCLTIAWKRRPIAIVTLTDLLRAMCAISVPSAAIAVAKARHAHVLEYCLTTTLALLLGAIAVVLLYKVSEVLMRPYTDDYDRTPYRIVASFFALHILAIVLSDLAGTEMAEFIHRSVS